MSRRFLYMVVGNCSIAPTSHTLHRIKPSRLFYPKDSPERAAAAAAAGARATTMEAAAAAAAETERASKTKTMQAEAGTDKRARKAAWRAAMRQSATKRTKPDGAEKARLPAPHMKFSAPGIAMDFALMGQSKDKILAVDGDNPGYAENNRDAPGRAVLYDDASHSVRALLGIGLCGRETVPVAVGDNLYFMEEEEEILPVKNQKHLRALIRYPAARERDDDDSDWHWYSFPPPPYDPIGTGADDPRPRYPVRNDMLGAYAVVGGSHIWASTRIRGTYSMDTVSGTWSRASVSPLPFRGRAEFAPEHGLWFGFPNDEWQSGFPDSRPHWDSSDIGLLGAWDLNSVKAGGAASSRGVWEGFGAPSEGFNVRSHLLHLGDGGRFCVAKMYQMYKPLPPLACPRCYNDGCPIEMNFASLTGVEVERCDGGELRMIKHRSCKYSFGEHNFPQAVL